MASPPPAGGMLMGGAWRCRIVADGESCEHGDPFVAGPNVLKQHIAAWNPQKPLPSNTSNRNAAMAPTRGLPNRSHGGGTLPGEHPDQTPTSTPTTTKHKHRCMGRPR